MERDLPNLFLPNRLPGPSSHHMSNDNARERIRNGIENVCYIKSHLYPSVLNRSIGRQRARVARGRWT